MPGKYSLTTSPNGSRLSKSQERVIKYIEEHGSISPMEAENHLHNHRLASTIEKLRHAKGYDIVTIRVPITNAYGEPTWYGRYAFK